MSNDPNPDDLFCPHCGANIDRHIGPEIAEKLEEPIYLHGGTVIFLMTCCYAYVQDGEFLSRADAREKFA